MRERRQRLRLGLFLGVGVAVATVATGAWFAHALRSAELQAVDARFSLRGDRGPPRNIAIVDIDDATFDDLNVQWPFPRSLHAGVIDRLRKAGARAIVYDVQFTEPTTEKQDNALIDAVARAGHVVLATTEVDEHGRSNVLGGDRLLGEIGARAGSALFPGGEVIRRYPYAVNGLVSLPVAGAEAFLGHREPRRSGSTWIDFAGPPGTFRTYSFSRVLADKVPASAFRSKLVVVGTSAPTLHDTHATSVSQNELMSGAEVEANAIDTELRGRPLGSASWPVVVALIIALSLIPPVASLRLGPRALFPLVALVGILLVIGEQVVFNSGLILPLVIPFAALVAASVVSLGVHYFLVALERERVRDLFARFVPEQVVGHVLARTDGELRLGGVQMEATVLFADLRSFTAFAEGLPAPEVIDVLNHYLTEMSDAILAHGGTLVSYQGDGIMAVFGAPIEQSDHAVRAFTAAREMVQDRLPRFNDWLRSRGHPPLLMGIGVNSGLLMSGNVGHERRLEYTAIGDTPNTASRLEEMTKDTPHSLFLSGSTRALLTGHPAAEELVFVGELSVRGRQAPVRTWTLPDQTSFR